MRSSILLMIDDFKLKCRFVRLMIKNDIYFYEAMNLSEASIKQIYLGSKLNLFIFQYDETKEIETLNLLQEIRKSDKEVRFLLVLPEYKVKWLDWAVNNGINDVLVLPLEDQELIRKIISLTPKVDHGKISAKRGNYDLVKEEVRKSKEEGYSLSFLLIDICDFSDIESKMFEQQLNEVIKTTDSLYYWNGDMYLMLFPYCKKQDLEVVKNKVLQAYDMSAKKLHTSRNIFIYGVTFPEDGSSLEEIMKNLEGGMDSRKVSSSFLEGRNAYSSQQVISLLSKIFKNKE